MGSNVKTVKQVCKCESCGNESEMVVTCSLEDINSGGKAKAEVHQPQRAKGSATCTHCGNEADMWIDI